MENATLRRATGDDAGAIQRVARESWHAAYDDLLGADRVEEMVDSWYDPERLVTDDIERPERPVLVATIDSEVVGFAEAIPGDTDGDVARLYRIYVIPEEWGRGIGGSLLEDLGGILEDRGFVELHVTVLAGNDVGVNFYESRGFRRFETTDDEQLGVEQYGYRKRL